MRSPEEISLLDVVEACQGAVVGNYCQVLRHPDHTPVCGYHRAMLDLQHVVRRSLERWTVQTLIDAPPPCENNDVPCKMSIICRSLQT